MKLNLNYFRKITIIVIFLCGLFTTAQVKVGSNPTTIATDANLQVEGSTTSKQFVILKNGTIGVGTTSPKATLDVVGEPANTSISDGFIAPRLTRAELLDKTYDTDQTGAIVYITTINGNSNLATQNINQTGYYYFDGTKWEKINKETILKANNNSNMVLEPNSLFFIQTGLLGAQNRALDVTLNLSKAIAAKTPIVGVAISSTNIAQDETFSFITSGQNVTIANLGNNANVGEHLWFRPQQSPLYANNPGTGQALRIGVVTANLPDGDVVVNFNPTWRSEIELGPSYYTATTWAGKPADAEVKDGDVFEVRDAGITYRRATWFNGSWLLDKGIFPFLQSLTYAAGDVIQNGYELYYANAAIAANTPFTEGTTGATWRKTGSVQAENGETSSDGVTSISIPAFNTWTDLPITATLPTPGTYEVIAEMDVAMPGAGARGLVGIKANGTLDNTSVRQLGFQGSGYGDEHVTIAHTITVSAATTLKLAQYRIGGDIQFINDGSNFVANSRLIRLRYKKIGGFLPVTQVKSFTEPITITATTTNPTKATVALTDYINIVDDGSGWCTVTMSYRHASSLGSTSGNGQYLFKLPAGYKFDNTVHPVYNVITGSLPTFPVIAQIIPGSFGFVTGRGANQQIHALAYSDNQFRLVTGLGLQGTGLNVNVIISSGYFQLNDGNSSGDMAYNISFRFKKQ